jgi:hypothetical protein
MAEVENAFAPVLISKPVGGVKRILPVREVPETLKLEEVEEFPTLVYPNAPEKDVVFNMIEGPDTVPCTSKSSIR